MKKYILVCDDDKNLNEDVKDVLEKKLAKNHGQTEIISVYSREEAIKQLSRLYFSLAIIDLNLEGPPPMDWSRTGGVKVIQQIKHLGFNTKIIVISASPETELSFSLSKNYNIDAYIQKGKSTASFRELITKSLELIDMSSPPVSSNVLTSLSGLNGESRTIWESNVCTSLQVQGGYQGLLKIATSFSKKYYPFKYIEGSTLSLNKKSKILYGKIWSYRVADHLNICIYNKKNIDGALLCSNTGKKIDEINIDDVLIRVSKSEV